MLNIFLPKAHIYAIPAPYMIGLYRHQAELPLGSYLYVSNIKTNTVDVSFHFTTLTRCPPFGVSAIGN